MPSMSPPPTSSIATDTLCRGPTTTTTTTTTNNPLLGMIVDKSSFDESEDFGLGKEYINDQEQHFDFNIPEGATTEDHAVVRNGKVRRRLRWKPPQFRKKKPAGSSSSSSSNSSVISSLTSKSQQSSRSFFTTRSGKSNQSFHTFHSTETPVMNNRANLNNINKINNITPPRQPRKNFVQSFQSKHSTIEGNRNIIREAKNSLRKSNKTESPQSPSTTQIQSSSVDKESDPLDTSDNNTITSPSRPSKRPPRDRTLRKHRSLPANSKTPLSPAESSISASTATQEIKSNLLDSPGTSSTDSRLSSLPQEYFDDLDRQVKLCVDSPKNQSIKPPVMVLDAVHGADEAAGISNSNTLATTPQSTPTRSNGHETPQNLSQATAVPGDELVASPKAGVRRSYHRPIDSTVNPTKQKETHNNILTAMRPTTHNNAESTVVFDPSSPKNSSDSVNAAAPNTVSPAAGTGNCLEAEHNLKAIHDMAAEHLAHKEYVEAIEVFEEILRAQQERYGQSHYRVGTALHNLGVVYLKSENHEEAIQTFERAVLVRKEALVPNHPDVAVSLAQLGVAYLEYGQYQNALVVFRESLNIRRTLLGENHPKCSKILNNIGCALYSLEELEGSRHAFEEALKIQRDTLRTIPSNDNIEIPSARMNQVLLSIASTLLNIGSIRMRCGNIDEATIAIDEALLIQQSVLGDDHPTVLSTVESMSYVESNKAYVIPSANDLLSKWADPNDRVESEERALVANTAETVVQDQLDGNLLPSLSWFHQLQDAIADGACGPLLHPEKSNTANTCEI